MTVVLDSSVALAIILGERFDESVTQELSDALISTVNAAEVYSVAARDGIDPAISTAFFATAGLNIEPFTLEQAAIAGKILPITKTGGLSFGDRCCIALAIDRQIAVLTADRVWLEFAKPLGVQIKLIR